MKNKTVSLPASFPSLSSLRCALVGEWRALRRLCSKEDLTDSDSEFVGTDIRLQVTASGWTLHTGSSDYDQDHRGFWGASSLSYGKQNLLSLARELLEDARESHAQSEDGESWRNEQTEKRALLSAGLHPSQTGMRKSV